MKKEEVKIGGRYAYTRGGKVIPVRIDALSGFGGWNATALEGWNARSLETETRFRIKSARWLRRPEPHTAPQPAAKAPKNPQAGKEAKAEKKPATGDGGAPRAKRTSLLEAAIHVLAEAGEPMNAKGIMDCILADGLWATKGKTPEATLYSAIFREIKAKGDSARFVKTGRGQFALRE